MTSVMLLHYIFRDIALVLIAAILLAIAFDPAQSRKREGESIHDKTEPPKDQHSALRRPVVQLQPCPVGQVRADKDGHTLGSGGYIDLASYKRCITDPGSH